MEENYLKRELYELLHTDSTIFEFIQSGSLDGIWYWDLEHPEHEWMSIKFWETLGYDPQEKTHSPSAWQDLIFPEDLYVATENLYKHCEDPQHPYDQIVRYKHKDGSTIWIRCRGLAIRDAQGKPIRMLGAHTNITTVKETEKRLIRLTIEYEKVFNGTQDAMFLIQVGHDNSFLYMRNNLAHQNRTGISLSQIRNKTPQQLLGKEAGDLIAKNYQRCVDERISITYEECLDLPKGSRFWSTTLTPIIERERVTYIVGSATDITERKALELELEKYAHYDMLTRLPNRRLFFQKLEQMIKEKEPYSGHFGLLYVDLDGFKNINDAYGHEVGDRLLIVIGDRLVAHTHELDIVARLGGDEFAIITEHVEGITILAKDIHASLLRSIVIDTISCTINASIGIAIYPQHGKDGKTLLRNADSAMYTIKKKRHGGFSIVDTL